MEAEVGEGFRDFREEGAERFNLFGGDFDAGFGVEMADAGAVEAVAEEDDFGEFDLVEFGAGDGLAVGDAGAEAGAGWFVPIGETEVFGEVADVVFVESVFGEGGADLVLAGGLQAGAVVAEVVGVGAV